MKIRNCGRSVACPTLALLLALTGCSGNTEGERAEARQPEDDAGSSDGPVSVASDGGSIQTDAPSTDSAPSCGSATFELSETQELVTIPANVRYMHVKAWGAGGNGEGQCSFDDSGLGGYTEGVFEVTPGTPLIVIVGQRGRAGMTGEELFKFGFGQWGGGGLSGVFTGTEPITEASAARALIIAGGGGGASAPGCHPGGTGNHPSAGGQANMLGGAGADDVNSGGGGYIGGVGGAHLVGGNGGSGYVSPSALDSRLLFVEPGAGKPPLTDDVDYDGLAGSGEQNGLVVMHFSCGVPVIH